MSFNDYSVLMSVYHREKAEYLRIAMNSMWNQTVPTNDFVLMCDGPLTPELDAVIDEMKAAHPDTLRVIRFPENNGLGYALQIGVKECRNELIARMDSDDISRPERCEKELAVLSAHPEISIVGSFIEEFTDIEPGACIPSSIKALRVVSEKPDKIIAFAKHRNPFNHMSVMYRKADVLAAGNYQDEFPLMEDYYLWIRMLLSGFNGCNIHESLVYVRIDKNTFKRRSGSKYRNVQQKLFKYMKNCGFISYSQYIRQCILRAGSSIAPNWLRMLMFKIFLRKT